MCNYGDHQRYHSLVASLIWYNQIKNICLREILFKKLRLFDNEDEAFIRVKNYSLWACDISAALRK